MVTMSMYKEIKKFKGMKQSNRQIAKDLNLARETVNKYARMDEQEFLLRKQSMKKERVFEPYRDFICRIYQENQKKVYTASVYDVLQEKFGELPGTPRTLRNYIRHLKEAGQIETRVRRRFYLPVEELPLGKQLQLDFGETWIESGEKVYLFCTVLSGSRYKYVEAQGRPFRTEDVIEHLLNCFDYIGGIPEEIVIDQDRTMVAGENEGDIQLTRAFKEFKEEQGFDLWVCRPADPESKGKIEEVVKFTKTSCFSARKFFSLKQVQDALAEWLPRRANGYISQATGKVPAQILPQEQAKLQPIKRSIFRKGHICEREERKVSAKGFISHKSSFYSVPCRMAERKVGIYASQEKLFIFEGLNGNLIAEHELSPLPGQHVVNKKHFRPSLEKLETLRDKASAWYREEDWKQFVQQNYTQFRRYYREQYHRLEAFLKGEPETAILTKALALCLENEKVAARDLEEMYEYVKGIEQENLPDVMPKLLQGIRRIKTEYPDVTVAQRKLSAYSSLCSIMGGFL